MKSFFKEFETFAVRGNAIDLAVGVVIGAAFGQITNTLSTNILTPIVGLFLGGLDFSTLAIPLGGSATLNYGLFLQALLNFVLIALALFLLVKLLNRLIRKQQETPPTPAEREELTLLREIRDVLKSGNIGS